MKTSSRSFILLSVAACAAIASVAACSGAPTVPGAGPARPPDCPLEFLYKAPSRPYEPLGDLHMQVTRVPAGGAVEALRPRACALGADAVIVTRNQVLNLLDHVMVEGTAIRYRREPAPPPEPEQLPTTAAPGAAP